MYHSGEGVVAVDDEGVAGGNVLTAIQHGAVLAYLVFDQAVEFGLCWGLRTLFI